MQVLKILFQQRDARNAELLGSELLMPLRLLEARVAAILAKSAAPDSVTDIPQTPFLDVSRVGGIGGLDNSDERSDSDSDADAFVFDSMTFFSSKKVPPLL
jgi:hypothetical protein